MSESADPSAPLLPRGGGTRERGIVLAVLAGVTSWVLVCSQQNHMSVNPASRYAGMEALVEHGTFAIDETSLARMTVDKVQWNGRFYSSKPPLLIALGAPAYALVHEVLGLSFRDDLYPTVRLLRVPLAVAPWFVAMILFAGLLRRVTDDARVRSWGFVALCAGGLTTAYASHLDNHSLAFTCLLGSALALSPAVGSGERLSTRRALGGGLLGGLAVAFDLGATPVVGIFGLTGVWALRSRPRLAGALAIGLVFAPVAQTILQWSITGTWRPFYLLPSAYLYPGSYWNSPIEFDALTESKITYAAHAFVGHHGLFSLTPWLALGALWLARPDPSPTGERLRRIALASALVVAGYYIVRTTNYGGRCVGMRWLIVLHPILALGAVRVVARHGLVERAPLLLGVVLGLSMASALSGAINPWEEGLVYAVFRALGMGSIDG